MRLGLFVDVDNVLTGEPVNMQFARILGVERDLVQLERKFGLGEIGNDKFNAAFIPLFRKAGFSRTFVEANVRNVVLRANHERLLSNRQDPPYLVSSGPDYFVNWLADQFQIPKKNVICSRYTFDDDSKGLLSRCISPVSPNGKSEFVRKHVRKFDFTVGIGDNPELDVFLMHCQIRILMDVFRSGFLTTREIEPIVSVVDALAEAGANAASDITLDNETSVIRRRSQTE